MRGMFSMCLDVLYLCIIWGHIVFVYVFVVIEHVVNTKWFQISTSRTRFPAHTLPPICWGYAVPISALIFNTENIPNVHHIARERYVFQKDFYHMPLLFLSCTHTPLSISSVFLVSAGIVNDHYEKGQLGRKSSLGQVCFESLLLKICN